MIPASFDYHAPKTLDEAIALLAELGDTAKILAGGQSLIPAMRFRLASPEVLIDITRIADLGYVEERGDHLAIGALAREHALETTPVIARSYPMLLDAAKVIADPIVRNRATVGGNLAHADPANDHPAVMLAYDAQILARSSSGTRTIAIDDLFVGLFETSLQPGEILTEIRIPRPGPGSGGAYSKIERKVGDYAVAAVAVQLQLDGRPHQREPDPAARQGRRGRAHRRAADRRRARGRRPGRGRRMQPVRGSPRPDRLQARPRSRPRQARRAPRRRARPGSQVMSQHEITVTVNGTPRTRKVEARLLLVHFIREDLCLTGTHVGCDTTSCGACTINLDGEAVKSCTVFAVQADGARIDTVEGLADGATLHPLQQGFWEKHGLQCGFCTPGMLMCAKAFLAQNPNPTEDDIRHGISGNLCRCTGYNKIVEAIQFAADKLREPKGT